MTQNLQFHNFSQIEDVNLCVELINYIRSSQWTPTTLRDAVRNNYPQIYEDMDFGLAAAIDELAFSHLPGFRYGRYWAETFGIPEVGQVIESAGQFEGEEPWFLRCEWIGAFTMAGILVADQEGNPFEEVEGELAI